MSVIDLAKAIDEGRKALASAKALFEAESKKVEDLRAAHAAQLSKALDGTGSGVSRLSRIR